MCKGLSKWFIGIAVAIGLLAATAGYSRDIVFTPTNTLVLRGEVNATSANKLIHSILTSPEKDLYLFIDSPGGSIFAGLRLIEAIKASDKNIICVANTAISMAFAILQGCDERLIVEDAVLMQHMASYGVEGQEPNNYTFAGFIHRMVKGLDKQQADRIGLSENEFYSKIRDDWWLWDNEAIQANAADGKVSVTCSPELLKRYTTETFQVFIFTIKLKFSACPLIPGPIEGGNLPEDAKKTPGVKTELNRILETYNARAIAEKRFTVKTNDFDTLQP